MRNFFILLSFVASLILAGCAREPNASNQNASVNQPAPTPERLARIEEKIDPSDVIEADVSGEPGPTLLVNQETDKKNLNCDKYNRVMINSSDNKVTITGACSQIMINGNRNQVSAVGAAEIVTYGSENTVTYSKYVNGKKPTITDTSGSNTISKVAATDKRANTNAK